jgi:hypothetical protein
VFDLYITLFYYLWLWTQGDEPLKNCNLVSSLSQRSAPKAPARLSYRFFMCLHCSDLSFFWLTLSRLLKWPLSITDYYKFFKTTLRRVRSPIVAVEKQWVLHNLSVCICSLRFPACNARAPYCHLWPAPLYNIFPHYLINLTIFEKKLPNVKLCFEFLYNLFWNFFILRKIERDMIKNVYWSSCEVLFMLVRF